MKIFIAGCARSGTTLLANLMVSFRDTYILRSERHYDHFGLLDRPEKNIVLKRTRDTHVSLHEIPSDIALIYSIRDPLDTLTSHHPHFPDRKFYVSTERWSAELAALRKLRARQPSRTITYVRYCDLVRDSDLVQQRIASDLGLEIIWRFSQGKRILDKSLGKYYRDADARMYLDSLPAPFRRELKEYCDEFGYELPDEYVTP
jgi:hypothetical protein